MRRNPLFQALLLTAIAAASPARAVPSLEVDPGRYDLGTLEGDTTVAFRFDLRNNGDEALRIEEVDPSCGCTLVSLPDSLVPPGGSVPLTGTFSTRKLEGPVTRTVILVTNDPARPRSVLLLGGWVQRALTLDRTTIRFPDRPAGEERVETVLFRPGPGVPFSILRVDAEPSLFRHEVTGGDRPGERLLRLVLLPREESVVFEEIVTVHTDVQGRETIELRLLGRIQAAGK